MDLGLAERVYVLTGASRGLGFATAQALVADGARVVISSRDPERVAEAVDLLGGEKYAAGVAVELSDAQGPRELVDTANDRFGRFDGALVSVGGPPRGAVDEVSDAQWRESFESVFLGTIRAARTFAAALPSDGAVGIVLSTSAKVPLDTMAISNGFRPGLAMAAKQLANEYGPKGVRVVSLLPGRILTDRNRELFAATGDPAAAEAASTASVPLRRLGTPEEFGRVAAFTLSPAASYLTGSLIAVDGGAMQAL